MGFYILTPAYAVEYRHEEKLSLKGHFTDSLFASGQSVRAELSSTDDVFVGAGEVYFSGKTPENLFVGSGDLTVRDSSVRLGLLAGGNISIGQTQLKDLIVAGGSIRLEKTRVQDDLIAMGGRIQIDQDTRVEGPITLGAGEVTFLGDARNNALISGGTVTLSGHFFENVRVYADTLRVEPGARFEKDLIHSAHAIDISPEATIRGTVVPLSPKDRKFWQERPATGIILGLLFGAGCLIVPGIGALLFPKLVRSSHENLRKNFWENLGKGFVVAIAGPILSLFLIASVLGAPLVVMSWPFLVVGWILAWIVAVFSVGDQLRRWAKGNEKKVFLWTTLGALALAIIVGVPGLGFIVSLVLILSALGTLYTRAVGQLKSKV